MSDNRPILITAGGTGGHIFPALAIANELIKNGKKIIWVGAVIGIENEIIPKHDIILEVINISGLRNKGFLKLLKLPFMLIRALYQAEKIVKNYQPSVVVSFGGYASFPVSLVAKLMRRPLIIHEQNSVAGLTNRILSKMANHVLVAYKNVLSGNKTILVGNPVRSELLTVGNVSDRYNSRNGGLRVLVMGGSLGASVFNQNLPYIFEHLDNIEYIIHQVGRGEVDNVQKAYNELKVNASVVKFIDDVAKIYAEVDLIICRSGALTVSEICTVGIASIFVPYPYAADDHQRYNITDMVELGAAFMVQQKDFSIQKLITLISTLDREKCLQMAKIATTFATPNTINQIVGLIENSLKK